MIVGIPEYAPDMPDMPSAASDGTPSSAGTSDTILNVLPLSPVSYGPMGSLSTISAALTARCQGAICINDNSGNVRIFAGDATKLYRSTNGTTFPDVSKVGGYSTASDAQWSYTQFGSRIIATNYVDAPQSYIDGTSTLFSDCITSGLTSLKAKFVATVKDFVVFFNCVDGTFGTNPQRAHWAAINDPTNIPTPGSQAAANALSDFQDVVGTHGRGMGIVGNLGSAHGALFFERAVWRMMYAGMPDVFDFYPAQGAKGLLASGGLLQYGPLAFYPAEDGFYAFDGSNPVPIGKNKIDRFFLADVNYSYLDRMSSAVDSKRGLCLWSYVGAGATSGVPNRVLIFSPFLNRWTVTDAGAINAEYLIRAATFGVTLEGLDAYGTLETLPYSLDSNIWTGGGSALGAFDSAHKFGYFDGTSLAATIDSSDAELIPGRQTMVNKVRPLVDSTGATIATCSRNALADTKTYSTDGAQERDGTVATRGRGRYMRFRTKIPAGTAWTQFSGVDIENASPIGMD